jgi:hypothetical protein
LSNNAKAVVFWSIAILLSFLTTPLGDVAAWIWALRLIAIAAGVAIAIVLIARDKDIQRDSTPFDYWTIAHTMAGVVMGAWSIPFPLVVIFTIAWEIFEYVVPGFGDTEIFSNRVVDIAVAWAGWIIVAGAVALSTHASMPWLLPGHSVVRGGM